jgi:Holliday junction resolvase
MSGRAPRRKGDRLERSLVRARQDNGFAAERVPLSGSVGGSYTGDLTVPLLGRDLRIEAKARGTGFNQLYAWLTGADLLIVRADRSEPLVIVPLRLAIEIAKAAENSR